MTGACEVWVGCRRVLATAVIDEVIVMGRVGSLILLSGILAGSVSIVVMRNPLPETSSGQSMLMSCSDAAILCWGLIT